MTCVQYIGGRGVQYFEGGHPQYIGSYPEYIGGGGGGEGLGAIQSRSRRYSIDRRIGRVFDLTDTNNS